MEQEPIVIRQLNDQRQSLRRLFHGIITRMSVHCVQGVPSEFKGRNGDYQLWIAGFNKKKTTARHNPLAHLNNLEGVHYHATDRTFYFL
ncbi:hypothetical protein QOZ95_002917 [Paenibacillus brasilensis]|uniref:Uncharacterized protein n=1 Tax=Paenibacillus brasilensis TaxID=128574 RepID=A0ABU0KZ72_9BACL|nr:hypothetical protein [Paenibacillus brasilensis]